MNNKIPTNQLVLYGFNNEIIKIERLHTILAHLEYKNEEINKLTLQDNSLHSIQTQKDLIQCKQLTMFHIFQAKIYKDQIFYNDLFYLYFGEGYITNFTVDDIKAGRCVLSHQAYYKREKMTLYQVMNIYNHSQAIYKRFTNFYNTEFHKKDHIVNNLFFANLPQFQSTTTQISIQIAIINIYHSFF